MEKAPEEITVCNLEVVAMPNGEVICAGKTVGWVKDIGKYLSKKVGDVEVILTEDELNHLLFDTDGANVEWRQEGLPLIVVRKEKDGDFE